MATLGCDKNGTKRILVVIPDGSRRTIRLGKCSKKDAESFKSKVEDLISFRILGRQPDEATSAWLAGLAPFMRDRLVRVGLVDQIEGNKAQITVTDFLTDFVERNKLGKKPATLVVWGQVVKMLNEYLPAGIMLQDVTAGHAKHFVTQLRARGLAPATVAKRVGFAKQFFQDAVDWERIDRNPFAKVKVATSSQKSNVEVSRQTIASVLGKCDVTWAAIVALARFGGLRTPSETLSIKWGDVDWELGRLAVPEPKVEHHEGRGIRSVPFFPELREHLEQLFEHQHDKHGKYPSPDSYVIDKPNYRRAAMGPGGWANANLRTQFLKILRRAGVAPWERLFHSMRASRQTELERTFPRHVVCAWMGNTAAVAERSYLLVTDEDYRLAVETSGGEESVVSAAQKAAHEAQKAAQKAAHPDASKTEQEHEKTPENTGETAVSAAFSGVPKVEVNGLETVPKVSGKPAFSGTVAQKAAHRELLTLVDRLEENDLRDLVAIAKGMLSVRK